MNIELYGIGTGLVGYWNFNEGEGTTVTDLTGNGNDGTISVATWSTEVPFNLQSESMKISGTTWQADTDKGQVGFTPGNPMTFRYFARRNGAAAVYEASHIALQGDGNFGTEPYAVVQVNSSTESIHPDRVSTLADLTVVEDSGPNNFSIAFNNYFIHPFDPLEFISIAIDSSAVIGAVGGSTALTVTPQQDWFGTTDLVIGATDGYFFAYDTISVTGLPVNDAPVVSGIPDSTINEDESFVFDLDQYTADVDNDSSEITYTTQVISGSASNAVLAIDDSSIVRTSVLHRF